MQLHIDTDAAYLVALNSRTRVAGYYYLSDKYNNLPAVPQPTINAPIHIECNLLKHVVSSAAEAETAGIFHNCTTAFPIKHMLEALGHSQHAIPIKQITQQLLLSLIQH